MDGLVEHYILLVMYPAGLTPAVQLWLGLFVVALNGAIYALALRQWRRARRRAIIAPPTDHST